MPLTPLKFSELAAASALAGSELIHTVQAGANVVSTPAAIKTFVDADFASKFSTQLAAKDTDDLTEGGNLYFTDARARAALGGNGLEALTTAEVDQLENIGAATISATQWGYVGDLDQALTTASNVQFGSVTAGAGLSVTGTAAISSNATVGGNLTVTGDLTVNGDSFVVNAATVEVEDNLMLLNSGEVGAGVTAGTSGIEIDRGTESNFLLVFDEASDVFRVGVTGNTQAVASREDNPNNTALMFWNDAASRMDTSANLTWDGGDLSITGNIVLSGTVDGVDIAALQADVDGFPDALKNLTTGEIGQLENIGAVTVSATQWGYLGALDQSLTAASDVSFGSVESNRAAGSAITTDYTLALTDANQYLRYTGAGNETVTIPANAAAAFAIGTEIEVFNATATDFTLQAAAGVTVNGVTAGNVIIYAYSAFTLRKSATDTWDYVGVDADAWEV